MYKHVRNDFLKKKSKFIKIFESLILELLDIIFKKQKTVFYIFIVFNRKIGKNCPKSVLN